MKKITLLIFIFINFYINAADLKDFNGIWRARSQVSNQEGHRAPENLSWGKSILQWDDLVIDVNKDDLAKSRVLIFQELDAAVTGYFIKGDSVVYYLKVSSIPKQYLVVLHLTKVNELSMERYMPEVFYFGLDMTGFKGTNADPFLRIYNPLEKN